MVDDCTTHPVPELREPLSDHHPAQPQPGAREHRINCEVDDQSEPGRPRPHHGLHKQILSCISDFCIHTNYPAIYLNFEIEMTGEGCSLLLFFSF